MNIIGPAARAQAVATAPTVGLHRTAMADAGEEPPVLVLVRDLMFTSRISAAARAAGIAITALRDPAQVSGAQGRRLIVDLNQPGALEAAAEWKQASAGDVVGFVSHVDAATIARARAAGIDRILPRSRFVEILPELLA